MKTNLLVVEENITLADLDRIGKKALEEHNKYAEVNGTGLGISAFQSHAIHRIDVDDPVRTCIMDMMLALDRRGHLSDLAQKMQRKIMGHPTAAINVVEIHPWVISGTVVKFPQFLLRVEGIDELFGFYIHPILDNYPHTLLYGRYCGYPDCCIQAFNLRGRMLQAEDHGWLLRNHRHSEGKPMICCEKHGEMSVNEVRKEVLSHRYKSNGFDEARAHWVDSIEFYSVLARGKLTPEFDEFYME